MQTAVANVAGRRLLSSCACISGPLFHSVAQPRFTSQPLKSNGSQSLSSQCRTGKSGSIWNAWLPSSWSATNGVVVSGELSFSSKPGPSRGLVTDDIEGIPVGEYGERYLVPNDMEEDVVVDDHLGHIRVERHSNGCVIVFEETESFADEGNGAGYLRCNLSGCYFTREAPAVKSFEVIEGEGWRLGYETAPESGSSFCAMVGAGGWSIALTAEEFHDFCTLVQSVRKGIVTMDEDAMSGLENIVLQVEKGTVWMQCTLPKRRLGSLQLLWKRGVPENFIDAKLRKAFEVSFILSGKGKRQAEGHWPAEAIFDMLKKVDLVSFD